VLYTDGVIEAMNAETDQFTSTRAAAYLARHSDADLPKLVEGLREEVRHFMGTDQPGDDITILAVRIAP
jgi:serine phosphatase RsbU (regulator of sigma subunit)